MMEAGGLQRYTAFMRLSASILLLFLIVATCTSSASAANASNRASHRTPNILIIVADDLGCGDIGAYGGTRIKTPNIDALARSGLLATQAYASANVCSPSRAGLMTGRYAIRSGLAWKVINAKDERGLPRGEETIAELARRAQLRTMYIGKWHLGNLQDFSPLKNGFDAFYGVPHSNDMPDFALYANDQKIEFPVDQKTLTRRYTEKAVEFIRSAGSKPFLLFLAHTAPHIPLHASHGFHGRSSAGVYGDVVEELDWSTGELLSALKEQGVLDDTLVIVTSDNGPFFEGSTAGLKGGKGNSWEGGYRVPFIASWPRVIRPGKAMRSMTMNIDVLPTLAEALGVRPAAELIDGRSLMPVFRGADVSAHEFLYYFNNERVVGVRTDRWKFVTHAYYTGSLGAFESFDRLPGFTTSYDLLFDAQGQDGESYSYADRHPDVVTAMRRELVRARSEFDRLRTRPLEQTFPE
jgi:arylsulfatase A